VRRIAKIQVDDYRLIGTYHEPASADGVNCPARDIALVILNFAQMPRAGLADLSVQLADKQASLGFPTFRFDMPGLGDSAGMDHEGVHDIWKFTESGGFAQFATALVHRLITQYHLRGVVLGGVCGGAITSLYATDKLPTGVVGLALLEPSYNRIEASDTQMPGKPAMKKGGANEKINRWRQLRTNLRTKSHTGGLRYLQKSYTSLRQALELVTGPRFPECINRPLVDVSRRVAARGLPILLVSAGSSQRWLFRYQVFGRIRKSKITFVEIEGTNHMLVSGGGKTKVIEHMGAWMMRTFPIVEKLAA